MLYSEEDALRIGRWCRSMTAPEVRPFLHFLPWMHDSRVVLYEYQAGTGRYYVFAHLLFDEVTQLWTLFSRRRAGGIRRYAEVEPARDVQRILDYLWDCDDPIFHERLPQSYPNPEVSPK
ncbi:DUF3024 domain-containing protein [Agrococcus casei]|uniref:DUF3024 domain-containing protein n=1 Tax=Agrococcus casei TaxID=343512 RepID=UPI000B3627B0|nr:DUF3024 domain-containing protein [Agrococcus casei]